MHANSRNKASTSLGSYNSSNVQLPTIFENKAKSIMSNYKNIEQV